MPERIASTFASRFRRQYLDPEEGVVERPGLVRRFWSILPVFAAFALFGTVVWLAYQEAGLGPPSGEPPLIRAMPDPVKLRPDDADSALAEEQGTVGRLWSDAEPIDQPERLLPTPEPPRSPPVIEEPAQAEALPEPAGVEDGGAVAALPEVPGEEPQSAAPSPATAQSVREAEAALDRLLAEVTSSFETGGGAGPSAATPPDDQARADQAAAGRPADRQEGRAPAPQAAAAAPTPAPAPTTAAEQPPPPALPEVRPARAPAAPPARPAEPSERRTETAALTPTEAPASRPPIAPDGDYRIQLAAVRGEADARRAWDLFMGDLGPVLAGMEPIFERAETANGVFYRVQVGPFASQDAAESLCEQLKQRNASCFVIRR